MTPEQPAISRAVSDVLTGFYNRKRLTQEVVAARADMSVVTLQKKLKGKAPITATDLVVLSEAIGVDPREVLDQAMKDVSEASHNVNDLSKKRAERDRFTGEGFDEDGHERAANHDPEHELDEPEAP